ncbi:hypothetical protein GQ600_15573 [Phytophthora cactorum]|nr:hypothetical protein GQ600_15573 [Phytophthora cactorum]
MAATEDAAFAKGMFVTIWPKLERCNDYAEKAEGSSLVSYADRLRNFPARVERLQKKLARIQDRLLAMKESGVPATTKFSAEEMAKVGWGGARYVDDKNKTSIARWALVCSFWFIVIAAPREDA